MATRRSSWRKTPASTQTHHRRPQKHQSALPFSGVEDQAVLTLFTHLLAKNVNVNAANGAVYSGLFSGTHHSPNSNDLLLTLRYARLVRGKPVPSATVHDLRGNTAARILIPFSRVTTVLGAPFESQKRGFVTDSQISRGSAGAGRELQRFEHFETSETSTNSTQATTIDQQTFGSIADTKAQAKWDQFRVNQTKFGVTTSFDESQYTTMIDRNSKDFAERKRVADRLAEEIESTPSENTHIREERNQDSNVEFDEEARYSGVTRPQLSAQQPRPQVSAPAQPADRPRLSYAAAAAASSNNDTRQAPLSKPPSAGATQASTTAHKATPGTAKNGSQGNRPASSYTARYVVPGGKPNQDHYAKSGQSTIKSGHAGPARNASNGKTPTQAPKSAGKKGPSAFSKAPQQQAKGNAVASNKASNASTTGRAGAQAAGIRSSAQAANPKPSTPVVSTKTGNIAGRGSQNGQSSNSLAEGKEAKSHSQKVSGTIPTNGKDKPGEERSKSSGRERPGRDSIPQLAKVRAALTGRTSPNQSRNSPLPTPAVADTSAVGVLNLDAQTPNLGPEQIKRFEAYKTNREFQSIAANRERITDDLKKFSTQLDSKNGSLRRSQNSVNSASNSSALSGSSAPRTGSRSGEGTAEVRAQVKTESTNSKAGPALQETADPKSAPVDSGLSAQGGKQGISSEGKAGEKQVDSKPTVRAKSKIKLNPNAQEFKFNPDAPSFKPASQKPVPQMQYPPSFNPYSQAGGSLDYSQQIQMPQSYTVPMQALGPIAYAAQPYMVVPTVPTAVGAANGSPYPFVQQAPSFNPAHVAGRFSQGTPAPAYGYSHVTPMVLGQAPQQRLPASPYYYSSGPAYGGGQGPGQMAASHQQHVFQQNVPPQMQNSNMPIGGRGGHGYHRRGGPGRGRGKNYSHEYSHGSGSHGGDRQTARPSDNSRHRDNATRQ